MRLLERHDNGGFSLTKEFGDDVPHYAILSHTWGADTEEVTFEDLTGGIGKERAGYDKIRFCGEQARRDGLQYFWVDTCCINKANSTELSEAINSMFRWYQNATRCYVYLSDVSTSKCSWRTAFRKSRWFTRGWTLQELIAPPFVEFFGSDKQRLGDKRSLEGDIHEITGIPIPALQGTALSTFSVDDRMSWARNRTTKREEDKAYSLLGIFGIQMMFIYSEGAENAFERLREEIYKRGKKRQRDELSVVSEGTFSPTKRLKTPYGGSFSTSLSRGPEYIDPDPLLHSEDPVPGIDATTKQSLIKQLYFTKIDERLKILTAAQGTTCRWFLTKPEYTSWQNVAQQPSHGGFLWIKGNPGTGKSTLMKFLFEEAKHNAKSDPSQITLSFFFLARGTLEEKSVTGLYRSLLHKLFERTREMTDSLEWMTADGARVIQRDGWNEEALKQTLRHAIRKLGDRSLTLFVDALDECDKDQVANMVCFFEELCDRASEAQVWLQICFSSRHYPTVVIQKGIEVILEDESGHTEDIEYYVKSKLRLGKSKQAVEIQSEIREKSSKIFLWVVLVIDILNSEYPHSSISIKKIRERLKQIPPGLTELFEMILRRDTENLEQLQICLKWILFATRPLKPPELYFATQLGLDKTSSTYWDQEDVDPSQLNSFVRNSSKGLAEVTQNNAFEVQFIHESVREFLLDRFESQWSRTSGNFVGDSHEILRDCCLAQLNASINQAVDIPSPLPQAYKAAQLRETVNSKFPFLKYSVLNILRHANSAQQNAMQQESFLIDFHFPRWVYLYNLLEERDFRRYKNSVSMLYIHAEWNLAELIRHCPQKEACFKVEGDRYGLPFFAALATESSEAICALLKIQAEAKPLKSKLHGLYRQYCQCRKNWAKMGDSFHFLRRRTIASYVAEYGDEILLSFLIESGECMVDCRDKDGRTPLHWASRKERLEVIKVLLEHGANIATADKYGQTPLYIAQKMGTPKQSRYYSSMEPI